LQSRGETKKIYFTRGESKEKNYKGKNKSRPHYRGYQHIYPFINGDLLIVALDFFSKLKYDISGQVRSPHISNCILYIQTMKELE
jgi:hypothetical protein